MTGSVGHLFLPLHHSPDKRREEQLHGQLHLAAGHHDGVGAAHETVVNHAAQVLEIDALGVGETDHHHALVGARNVTRDERVGGVDHRHALEVDMGVHELRADVVHVIGHAPQDGVGDCLKAVATLFLVAPELLNPLQVDHRHHANQQIGVLRDVDLGRDHGTVQAFIKQQVGAARHVFPRGEGAWVLVVGRGFLSVVQVFAALANAGFTVSTKQLGQLGKQVVFGAKVAEVFVTCGFRCGRLDLHGLAVKAVKAVALNHSGRDFFAAKNVLEGAGHRGGAGTAGAGNGDDGVAHRHGGFSSLYKNVYEIGL